MIVLNVTYTTLPGQGAAYVKAMEEEGLLQAIRQQPGCLGFSYYLPTEGDHLLLVEHWADQAALDAHAASAPVVRSKQLKEGHITATQLETFQV